VDLLVGAICHIDHRLPKAANSHEARRRKGFLIDMISSTTLDVSCQCRMCCGSQGQKAAEGLRHHLYPRYDSANAGDVARFVGTVMAATVRVRTMADQIAEKLRQAVLAGEFPPGHPLREDDLAEQFGVSRHPIRKVLQQLTLEGLLSSRPNCGVTVAADASAHVAGVLTPMRQQLELYALRLAGAKRLKEAEPEWRAILRHMTRAAEDRDEHAILSLDAEFHQLLLSAAGIPDFIPLWLAIYGRMRGHHRLSNRQVDDFRVIPFVHQELLASLLSNDVEQSARDLHSHLENGKFNQMAKAAWKRQHRRKALR
jgi:GntR family transcriptional regulator, rspAB operon transcriptional repressor